MNLPSPSKLEIILASSSTFRKQLLKKLTLPFNCQSPEVDEAQFKNTNLSPEVLSLKLAKLKALEVQKKNPNSIIIGSDQVLSINDQIMDKPICRDKAIKQLQTLSGNTHQLLTALVVLAPDNKEFKDCIKADLTMRQLTHDQIERYIDHDDPLYCCGSYKLEGLGISLFKEIKTSDHSSIVGLPLIRLTDFMYKLGIVIP